MKPIYTFGTFAVLVAILIIVPANGALTLSGTEKYVETVQRNQDNTFSFLLSSEKNDPATDYEIVVRGLGNTREGNYIGIDPTQDTNIYSARPYINIDNYSIHLEPGQSVKVTASIHPTWNAGSGLYALINIHPKVIGMGNELNIPVMVTIKDAYKTEVGAVEDVTLVANNSTVTVTTKFKNTGDHHYFGIKNKIVLLGNSGELGQIISQPINNAIIPYQTVEFTQTFYTDVVPGDYSIKSYVLSSEGKEFGFNISNQEFFGTQIGNVTGYAVPGVTIKPAVQSHPITPRPTDVQGNPIESIDLTQYTVPAIIGISLLVIIIGIAIAISNRKTKKKLTYKK